ncbi:S-adenosyl-L-methionine-dependent methyltransferase [Trichophaea hybrida]|nr:S-adenosyl-L-methionine-dependent methyltransferase [Trichophaea hybrida]
MRRSRTGKASSRTFGKSQRICDVGTGTGIWAIDVADLYPSAEVIGTDLSLIQPVWVPPNCKFEVDDTEIPWTFQAYSFDFVPSRNLVQSIGDWPKYMSEVYRCTKPGGYVELAELGCIPYSDDNTIHPAIEHHFNFCGQAPAKIGRAFVTAAELKTFVEEAGFVDVQVADIKHPFGPWPKNKRMKQIGAMAMLMCETGFEAYGMAVMTRILGMKKEDAMKECVDALKGVKNKNHYTYNLL